MALRVFYGFTKLTKKAIRKPELAIWFENYFMLKNEAFIERRMIVVHTRRQTKEEEKDGVGCTRMFVKYGYFIDLKPYFGDIDKVIEQNFLADQNNVKEEELMEIQTKLRNAYFQVYKRDWYKEVKKGQLALEL